MDKLILLVVSVFASTVHHSEQISNVKSFDDIIEKAQFRQNSAHHSEHGTFSVAEGKFSTGGILLTSNNLVLHGSNSHLCHSRADKTARSKPTENHETDDAFPSQRNNPCLFQLQNSSMSLFGWILDVSGHGLSVQHLVSSSTEIHRSVILSNWKCSPFIVVGEDNGLGSSVAVISSTHSSPQNHILPLVAVSSARPEASSMTSVSVIGIDLALSSSILVLGTGPLFSFGLSEGLEWGNARDGFFAAETLLSWSRLVNITSQRKEAKIGRNREPLFGSGVMQRMVGCDVDRCSNHNTGTGLADVNLGGSLRCLNSSFSSCVRTSNSPLSFEKQNITQDVIGRQVIDSSSSVTSVTYTLCTFKDMVLTEEGDTGVGGASVFMLNSSSSLSITQCFFHRCKCSGAYPDGGAVYFACTSSNKQPLIISKSSFSECTTNDCGGTFLCKHSSALMISDSFFYKSEAVRDGVGYLQNITQVVLSNCAFVTCQAQARAGTLYFNYISSVDITFILYRNNSCTYDTKHRDLYFSGISTSLVNSDTIQFCDSTSGAPNVYIRDFGDVSHLVPQLSSTPAIQSVDVSIEGYTAKVTVTTKESISGKMGVLLSGSNVPRLVHVVFGNAEGVTRTGTAEVSSGPNGVLPAAQYTNLSSAILGGAAAHVYQVECPPVDHNTASFLLKGCSFQAGDYFMEVKFSDHKLNVSLSLSDSFSLIGEAPLYPATASGRLDYETNYSIVRIVWKPEGLSTTKDISHNLYLTFVTPDEPARVESVDWSLNADQTIITIVMKGRQMSSNGQKVIISNGEEAIESNGVIFEVSPTQCSVVFGIGLDDRPNQLKFGEQYELKSVGEGNTAFVGNPSLFFAPVRPPTVTQVEASFANAAGSLCVVSLSGYLLVVGTEYKLTLNENVVLNVRFISETKGESGEVSIGQAGLLKYDTTYTVTSLSPTKDEDGPIVVMGTLSFTTQSKPKLFVSDGGSDNTEDCGTFVNPCNSLVVGWKRIKELNCFVHVPIMIWMESHFGENFEVGDGELEVEGMGPTEAMLVVDEWIERGEEAGVVGVRGGRVSIRELTIVLQAEETWGMKKKPTCVVSGFGECEISHITIRGEGERVGMGLLCWSGGDAVLRCVQVREVEMGDGVSLLKFDSERKTIKASISELSIWNTTTRQAGLVVFSSDDSESAIEFERSVLIGVKRIGGDDGVLNIETAQKTVQFSQCTFCDCGSVSSEGSVDRSGGVLMVGMKNTKGRVGERHSFVLSDCLIADCAPTLPTQPLTERSCSGGGVSVDVMDESQVLIALERSWVEETEVSGRGFSVDKRGVPIVEAARKVRVVGQDARCGVVVWRRRALPVVRRSGSSFSGCILQMREKRLDETEL
ncbi:hypothetical protein BLNAU_16311 [Blattamonas nauphoetae]|uniref:Uncharacterized protein n=1 Tax=Blattamonas nauphoetae TaxID=2049346 RepID=A0ABQ9XEQ1_9EUKA|nr:hypothetical protein BLNAU_16311 [Blattamonas nauphoetae]